jgi:hypothetical protein
MIFLKSRSIYKFIRAGYLLFLCSLIISCFGNNKEDDLIKDKRITLVELGSSKRDMSKYLKEDELQNYILTAASITPNKNLKAPFDTLNYDKIIAYDFEGSEEPYPGVLDQNQKFVPVILKQQALTQRQADEILSALTKRSTYGEVTAACFNPHLGLLFFRENRFKAAINICLDCNYLNSDVVIPAETHFKVNKGKDNEYARVGFTQAGKKAIVDLCSELGFYYGQAKKK